MKNNLKELNVDFIGGQEPLTNEEELSISKFIKTAKEKRVKANRRIKETSSQKVRQPA